MKTSVSVVGANEEARRLNDLARNLLRSAVKLMKDAGRNWKSEASGWYLGGNRYRVPRPPQSKYRRTGNYGASTSIAFFDNGLTVKLTSGAAFMGRGYARYVGGDELGRGQAKIHAGRWPVIYEAAVKQAEKVENKIAYEFSWTK